MWTHALGGNCREDFKAPWVKTLALRKGSTVTVIQVQPGWCYVSAEDGSRGFVPTAKLTTPRGSALVAEAKPVSEDLVSKQWYAIVMEDYQAEIPEALTLAGNSRVQILYAGEDWTYVEHNRQKGFLPTPLLKVNGKEDLLLYCKRQGIPVAPAGSVTTDASSDRGLSKDLDEELEHVRKVRAGEAGAAITEGGVRIVKTPETVIPSTVWSTMADAERHRQRMIYGLIHAEFLYNKQLWALNQIAKEFQGKQQQRALSQDERDALFRDTDAIYALSNAMLAALLKRWESSPQGVVHSVADVLEGNLHAFEGYLKFCSRERRAMQQHIFLEHKAMFGSPFNAFLEQLAAKSVDLEALVGKPVQYLEMWPVVLRNLMKDTSRSRQEEEYNALRKLKRYFTSLVSDLRQDSHALRADLKRRFDNYVTVEPHLRGRRLLKESPAKVVSGAGVDYGNHAFLFDSCLVFARRANLSAEEEERGVPAFKALKMVKLVGLRIVDVQKGTITVRTGGDRYFVALPNASLAVEWRNLIGFKSYRHEIGEVSEDEDGPGGGEAHVRLPSKSPAYDAHVSRVRKMQDYISGLLNEVPPPLPLTGAGRETLALRAAADPTRKTSPRKYVTTAVAAPTTAKAVPSSSKAHEMTESDSVDVQAVSSKLPATRTTIPAASHFEPEEPPRKPVAAVAQPVTQQPTKPATPVSARPVVQQPPPPQQRELTDSGEFETEWEEEDESTQDAPVAANNTTLAGPNATHSTSSSNKSASLSQAGIKVGDPITPAQRSLGTGTGSGGASSPLTPMSAAILSGQPGLPSTPANSLTVSSTFGGPNTTMAGAQATAPKKAPPAAAADDDSDLSSTTQEERGGKKNFKAPHAMYKTLTGQLENIISAGATREGSKDSNEDDVEKDSDEWEEEEVSVTDSDSPRTRPVPAATTALTPMPSNASVMTQTPSIAMSAILPAKTDARSAFAGNVEEEEEEEEGEWETVSDD